MAVQTERDFAFVYRDENGDFLTFYPKTLAKQVLAGVKTIEDHVYSNSHLLSTEKEAMINAGRPNGYIILDENGYIPMAHMNKSLRSIESEFANINDMLTNGSFVMHGALAMVIDASADPTVTTSWAVYRRDSHSEEYWDLDKGWEKIIDMQSIDLDMDFAHVPGKPNSSAEQIDDLVRKAHVHKDKGLLDLFDEDENGKVRYNGERLAYDDEVQRVVVSDYIDENFRGFDIWFKPTFSQSWWDNDGVEYAGTSCYEKYRGREDIVVAQKLRTEDATTVARMFYQCYNLEETQQYNTISCVDFTGEYQECRSLRVVPIMGEYGTLRGVTFDNMFNGCSMLEYSPEMNLANANSVIGMYSGCISMTRVLPFGSTSKITNMRQWFNGCTNLETITDPIDFSSITSADAVSNMFNDCESLQNLKFVEGTLTVSLSLRGTNITEECLIDIINGLPSVSTSGELKVLNLTEVPAALNIDYDILANAANRGWQVLTD